MKVTLVSTYTHPIALGLRYVSSYLKAAGHDVEMIFMSSKRDTVRPDYSPAALEAFIERLRGRELIGLSLMTSTFHRAAALTQRIRAAGIRTPIVWGGIHPTMMPAESLELADVICIGEGEEPLLQLVERLEAGRDPLDVPSLGFRGGGPFGNRQTFWNPVAVLEQELDEFPFPDYELETHWVAGRDGLEPARPENLRGALHTLRVETSRGCPYHCTFCNNAALLNLYRGRGRWVRLRSIDNVLGEIRQALACFPTIRGVNFVDDLFLVRSEAEIEEFAARYNEQVGLPLQLDAFPNTVTERKVRALARVPIELLSMGIESASADTLEHVYRRPTALKRIAAAMDTLRRHRIRTEYHYIVSNPFEPERNVIQTMRFIADHHRGRSVLRVFPLMFYPGTPLYERARAAGLIGTRDRGAYDHMGTGGLELARHDYLGIWLRVVLNLRNAGLPSWLAHRVIDCATSPIVRRLIDRRWFSPAVFLGYRIGRKLWRNLFYQPFIRPLKYLRPQAQRAGAQRLPTARWPRPVVNVHAQRIRRRQAAPWPVIASGSAPTARAAEAC